MDLLHAVQAYNTRVVLAGVMLLGLASGLVGCFMLLRKRSLMADATSHATLPGIALAFLIQPLFGLPSKFLPGLLLGALLTGLLGMLCIQGIQKVTRLREDAAMGIVLSVFYGFGISLLGIIQRMEGAAAAGLKGFIFGKTASMLASDAFLIGGAALCIMGMVLLCVKEFRLLCFDAEFAGSQGWPCHLLDTLLMGAVVGITVIGLQAVGLILMIALLVIPPAAARFWTHRLVPTLWIAAGIGAVGGGLGTLISAVYPDAPAGAVIVICQGVFFVLSLFFGSKSGVFRRLYQFIHLRRYVEIQHILRSFYEILERRNEVPSADPTAFNFDEKGLVSIEELSGVRAWGQKTSRRILWMMRWEGLVFQHPDGRWALTREGLPEAERVVRNHRLWELFLIHYADTAPAQVDRQADRIEHVLGTRLVQKLERLMHEADSAAIPESPHPTELPR